MFRVLLGAGVFCFAVSFAGVAYARALPAICGDGIVGSTEQCDDGNAVDGDGCSSACLLEVDASVPDDAGEAPDSSTPIDDAGELDAGALIDSGEGPPPPADGGMSDNGTPPPPLDSGVAVDSDAGSSGGGDSGSMVLADAGAASSADAGSGAGDDDEDDSCGCTSASQKSGGAIAFGVLLAGLALRARRRNR